jgi:hypothetical protein
MVVAIFNHYVVALVFFSGASLLLEEKFGRVAAFAKPSEKNTS